MPEPETPIDSPAPPGLGYLATEAARERAAQHPSCSGHRFPVILKVMVVDRRGGHSVQFLGTDEPAGCVIRELMTSPDVLFVTSTGAVDPETGIDLSPEDTYRVILADEPREQAA